MNEAELDKFIFNFSPQQLWVVTIALIKKETIDCSSRLFIDRKNAIAFVTNLLKKLEYKVTKEELDKIETQEIACSIKVLTKQYFQTYQYIDYRIKLSRQNSL